MTDHTNDFIQNARTVLQTESEAIAELINQLDHTFDKACELILKTRGHLIIMGMGKSGHVARKLAATFASTGTPAFSVHPAEAAHGDMGMITQQDLLLLLSNSGNTTEILTLLPAIEPIQCPIISLTGNPNSALAQASTVHINVNVKQEACALGLAPTASTTACMAMGDAMAIALQQHRGFSSQDFASIHPSGALGKRLTLRVKHLMHSGTQLPIVTENTTLAETILEMTHKGLGMTIVTNTDNNIIGIFTDGDLRRSLQHSAWQSMRIADIMTTNYTQITPNTLAFHALKQMQKTKITSLVVSPEEQSELGVIHLHDLLQAGLT